MTSASFSLQAAIFAALSADFTLQSLIGARLYDSVPQAPVFPYAVLGDDAETNWNTATEQGSEHIVTVDVSKGHTADGLSDVVRNMYQYWKPGMEMPTPPRVVAP